MTDRMKSDVAFWVTVVLVAILLAVSSKAADEQVQLRGREVGPTPVVVPDSFESRAASLRPADEVVKEIESQLKVARRALPSDEFIRTHNKIAELVDELRSASPDDHRVAKLLPERWASLNYTNRRDESYAEVGKVLETTVDPILKRDALFFQTGFKFLEPIDSPVAVSLAETFARQSPDDNRAGELLYDATRKLNGAWTVRIVLVVIILAVISTLTAATAAKRPVRSRKRWVFGLLLALLGLMMLIVALCAIRLRTDARQTVQDARHAVDIASMRLDEVFENFRTYIWTSRTGIAVALAGVGALILVVIRRRSTVIPMHWMAALRLWVLGFSTALAVSCAVDTCLIARKAAELRQRIVQEYPDSFRARMVHGQDRQRKRIGEPFELEFTDAISGHSVSMKDFREKVVVVDFWATWCGHCVNEIPEMKRIYAKYHDQGVEFIGISHDLPEEDGGLEALKAFVGKEQLPWPQFYESRNRSALIAGSAMNDFSEYWGIDGIPTVFLIDPSGNLYSTEARSQLETLIPRLLKTFKALSP